MTARKWKVWSLADDEEAYGENAGRHIITTEDGEDEITGIVYKLEDAELLASAPTLVEMLDNVTASFETVMTWHVEKMGGEDRRTRWDEIKKARALVDSLIRRPQ